MHADCAAVHICKAEPDRAAGVRKLSSFDKNSIAIPNLAGTVLDP